MAAAADDASAAAAASRRPAAPNLLGWRASLQAGRRPAAPNKSKDKAYATFDTLELYGGFSTVISDSVVTKPPMKSQWSMVLSTIASQTTQLNFSERERAEHR